MSLIPITWAWIKARCTRDQDTGCMRWSLKTSRSGSPVAFQTIEPGKRKSVHMRPVVYRLRHGDIPEGHLIAVSCKHQDCLLHLEAITKSEVVRRQWERAHSRASRTAGVTRGMRKVAKLDIEKAREIRSGSEPLVQVAARMGISASMASLIRRGTRWKEAASPFAGLMR